MKSITLKLSIFSMILLSLFLWSCKEELPLKDDISNYSTLNTSTYPDYLYNVNLVGAKHNEYLDSMYAKLSRMKSDTASQPNIPLVTYLINESVAFADNNGFDITNIDTTGIQDFYYDTLSISSFLDTNSFLSQNAKNILYDLDSVVNVYGSDGITLSQFEAYCDMQITFAYSLGNSTEAYIVGLTISVAKNSANYWNDNFNNWITLLEEESSMSVGKNLDQNINRHKIKFLLSSNAKKVIKADIKGAVYGAWETGKWGMVGGPSTAILMGISGGLVFGGSASALRAVATTVDIPWWLDEILP